MDLQSGVFCIILCYIIICLISRFGVELLKVTIIFFNSDNLSEDLKIEYEVPHNYINVILKVPIVSIINEQIMLLQFEYNIDVGHTYFNKLDI